MRRKNLRRLLLVAQNALQNVLPPIFGVVVSSLVIRLESPVLWGEFVALLNIVYFGTHVAAWGNRDYLLREFSLHPDRIAHNWQTSLNTRLLLFAALCIVLVLFPAEQALLMAAWGLSVVLAQSFDVLVVYRKDFAFALLVEIAASLLIAVGVVTSGGRLTANVVVVLYTAAHLGKLVIYGQRYRSVWHAFRLRVDPAYLRLALPFFLLGFSGLLASRIDLYAVTIFRPEAEVARYQVFINLMLLAQSSSNFILRPFLKGIYRLGEDTMRHIAARMFLLGAVLIVPAMIAAYGLLCLIYDLHYGLDFMLLGGLFVLPVFGYTGLVYRLFRLDRQNIVLYASLIAAAANLLLNLVLLPRMGIAGALLASALVQWGLLAFYLVDSVERKPVA